jgi:ElaB/YqjD/DUF883 family membrane-anchored ribosome-binding protein
MATKHEIDWEEALDEMRRDFDERLDVMQQKVAKAMVASRRQLDEKVEAAQDIVEDYTDRAREGVAERPLLALGMTLAAGVALGALIAWKASNRD